MPPTKTKKSDKFEPQFINVTNSVFLDSKARTSVRSQVMREYHRRRTQKMVDPIFHLEEPITSQVPLSAKGQTQKFRLDRNKAFQAWVPTKVDNIEISEGREDIQQQKPNDTKRRNAKVARVIKMSQPEVATRNRGRRFDDSDHGHIQTELDTLQELVGSLSLTISTPINEAPRAGAMDPFDSMSLLLDTRAQVLMHHYFNQRLYSSWLMMPMRKGLFSTAVHDAALFHTFLAHYVASYDLRYGAGDPAESLYHRMEAVRIVNERLADRSKALSDGTIAAVANMAVYEASNGSLESMAVHLKGLEEMVNMRGGTVDGGFDANVRRLIAWTDLHCANALSQPTRFPPLSVAMTPKSLLHHQHKKSEHLHTYASEAETPRTGPIPAPKQSLLQWTMSEVRDMSLSLQYVRSSFHAPQEDIWYSDKVYYLQFCLLEVLHNTQSSQLEVAMSIAALIYCSVCFRDLSFNFRVVGETVTRLKGVLENLFDEGSQEGNNYEALLWTVVVGGMAAEGKPEREWFVSAVRNIDTAMEIGNWESESFRLGRISWQHELDVFGSRLWKEAFG